MWREEYAYDRYGNRAPSAQEINGGMYVPQVQLTDYDAQTNRIATNMTYDAAGQITEDWRFRWQQYSYDANGRQWTAASAGNGLQNAATNTYDALGERVQTTDGAGGNWRRFIYDATGQLVAEYTAQGLQVENIYRNGQLLAKRETSNGVTTVSWVMSDHQGSARMTTNASGQVTGRSDYLPFGEELFRHQTSVSTRAKYALTERDETTNLEHTWFRKLDTRQGRWTSPDPYKGSMSLANPQSFNRYAYVNNDPVNMIDPSGLCTFNINISGLSGDRLAKAQQTITEIIKKTGHDVVFNNPRRANVSVPSFELVYVQDFSSKVSASGEDTIGRVSITRGGPITIYHPYAEVSLNILANRIVGTYGYEEGVIGAHEFGHWVVQTGHTTKGLMRSGGSWLSDRDTDKYFTKEQVEALNRLCPPPPPSPSNPTTLHETGHSGGGGGGGFASPLLLTGGGGWSSLDILYLWYEQQRRTAERAILH